VSIIGTEKKSYDYTLLFCSKFPLHNIVYFIFCLAPVLSLYKSQTVQIERQNTKYVFSFLYLIIQFLGDILYIVIYAHITEPSQIFFNKD